MPREISIPNVALAVQVHQRELNNVEIRINIERLSDEVEPEDTLYRACQLIIGHFERTWQAEASEQAQQIRKIIVADVGDNPVRVRVTARDTPGSMFTKDELTEHDNLPDNAKAVHRALRY